MDLTQGKLCREVRGVARRTDTVLEAFFAGAVDLATNDVHTGVLGADIVILATPVRTIVDMLEEIGPRLWPGTLVMDMGSTKAEICAAMDQLPAGGPADGRSSHVRQRDRWFWGGGSGLLYQCPLGALAAAAHQSRRAALATELAQAVGARPVVLEPSRHDRLVATISHLPFLLASALVHAVAQVGSDDEMVWQLAAGGFRDTSRVAASDTHMFMDILMTNRAAVLEQLDSFACQVHELRALLADADEKRLKEKLAVSQRARAGWKKTVE